MSRRTLIIVGAATACFVVGSSALFALGYISPREGPLGGTWGNRVGVKNAATHVTASFDLMENRTDSTFVLDSVDLVGLTEDEGRILGIGIVEHCKTEGQRDCGLGLAYQGWPPNDIDPDPVDGYRVEPGAKVEVLVGLRFVPARFRGHFEEGECASDSIRVPGIVVRYHHGVRHYRAEAGPEAVFRRSHCG